MRARIILGCLNFHNAEYNPTVSLRCGHSLVMSPRLLLICLLSGGLLTACQSLQSGGSGRGRGSLAGNGGYSDGNFYGDPSIPAPAGYPREGQEFDTAEGAPFSANDTSMAEVASVRPVSGSPVAGPAADPYGTAYAGSGASRVGSSYAGPSRTGTGSPRAGLGASPTPAESSYAGEHGAEQAEVRPYVEKPPVVVAETKPKSSGAAGSKAGATGSKKAVASSSGKKQATVASTGSARKTGGKSAGKEVKTAYSKTGQASGGKKGSKAGKASVVRVHEVKRGDSLSKLASRYGVTVAALKKRNKLSSSMIVVGKRLTID